MPETMRETALPLAAKAAHYLAERGIENARLEAELMLAALLGVSRLDLYLQHDRTIEEAVLASYRGYVLRRLKREPLQYILGRAAFRKLELRVDVRVLIPRPETEVLVDQVLQWLVTFGSVEDTKDRKPLILEIGTGSGAIALSLARESGAHVVATDVSAGALDVARDNAMRLGLAGRIDFRCGELWQAVRTGERFDAIVANPPYIAQAERDTLAPEVREWEPAQALFAGPDGLSVISPLVTGAMDWLLPGGLLALEVGAQQGEAVLRMLKQTSGYTNMRIQRDLADRERVVLAEAHNS
ncbi:MAG: peptide chain release factor N(5)-glutamine methyltransferase [Longimicrobiales bacterium]